MNDFAHAIRELHRTIHIFHRQDAMVATSIIVNDLIEIIENCRDNNSESIHMLWECNYKLQKILYDTLSEKFDRRSDKISVAFTYHSNNNFYNAYVHALLATIDVTGDTGFNCLFTGRDLK